HVRHTSHRPLSRLLPPHPPRPPLFPYTTLFRSPSGGTILTVTAGTSDLRPAREAQLTATYLGRRCDLIADVGVAGLHRVLARLRSEEHTSELQSRFDLVCRLLLEKKKIIAAHYP